MDSKSIHMILVLQIVWWTINRKPCFHVKDCKISHQDSKVNDKSINTLRDEYESLFEDGSGKIKVSRGKVHEYFGMTLDYSVKGQVKITMLDYINEIME